MPQKPARGRNGPPADGISDARFANFQTDPRFRLPSKRNTRVAVDKRFSRMLKDDEFTATSRVDRYGRKLKSDSKKKALQRLYEAVEDEDEDEEEKEDEAEEEEDEGLKADDDKTVRRELRRADAKYDPARGGGFSSSSESESESDSEEDGEEDEKDEAAADAEAEAAVNMQRYRDEQIEVPTGEVTRRLAVVNLDWDYVKSVDLLACFLSFVPNGGKIEKIYVYPSEFGKERMAREELEGPPRELFKNESRKGEESDSELEEDEDDEDDEDEDEKVKKSLIQEGDDQDFDSNALRAYQLDRLRYFYAVIICDTKETAKAVYEATDGREFLSSGNFMDLRFIPDEVTFDEDEPRDECDAVPAGYKPVEFVTGSVAHSKVKLSWDMHPEEASRKESMKKAFSGSRADIAENDLKVYLASSDDDDDDEEEEVFGGAAEAQPEEAPEPKLSKKELARRKMREALGLSADAAPKISKDAPVGDMQITFTSALSKKAGKGAKDPEGETTIEKYKRKEKERKEKRREKARAAREGVDPGQEPEEPGAEASGEDLGFDDPFFTSEEPTKVSKSSIRKEERLKKREAREAEAKAKAAEKAQLELLMAGNTNGEAEHLDHFDMNEIMRVEKDKKKKMHKKDKKKAKEREQRGGLQEDFSMDVEDTRFTAVFENHEFAIDPSNPKFKATPGMQKLLEEGRNKRKGGGDGEEEGRGTGAKKARTGGGELASLVESVKKKAKKR